MKYTQETVDIAIAIGYITYCVVGLGVAAEAIADGHEVSGTIFLATMVVVLGFSATYVFRKL